MTSKCILLGDTYAYSIQILLGFMCFLTLIYKRHIEILQRPLDIWLMDISKQGISSLFGHFIGIFYAINIYNNHSNQCTMYLLVYIIDGFLGLFFAYHILKLYENNDYVVYKSGFYGNPPSIEIWLKQTLMWIIILILSKTLCGFFILLIKNPLLKISYILAIPFEHDPHFLLFLVMIICPFILNIIQVWIQDNILMHTNEYNMLEEEFVEEIDYDINELTTVNTE